MFTKDNLNIMTLLQKLNEIAEAYQKEQNRIKLWQKKQQLKKQQNL